MTQTRDESLRKLRFTRDLATGQMSQSKSRHSEQLRLDAASISTSYLGHKGSEIILELAAKSAWRCLKTAETIDELHDAENADG